VPSVTLATLRQNVLDRLSGNNTLYTTPEIDFSINESVRILNVFCGIQQQSISVPGLSIASQLIYAVPATILIPLRATIDGRAIQRISLASLARNYRSWASDTTAKLGPIQRWAGIGIGQFVIHPADSIGGKDIKITGVVESVALVNSGDVVSLEDEFVDAVIQYAGHRCQLKAGGAEFASSSLLIQKFWHVLKQRSIFQGLKMPQYFLLTASNTAK
jgi:hypothetical protein